jgi:HEAT repeat protein
LTVDNFNDDETLRLIADLDHADKPTIRAAVDTLTARAAESSAIRTLLEQHLTQPGHKNYWPVAYILGQLPQPSAATIQTLLDALDYPAPDIRWAVALLIIEIAKRDSNIPDLLIDLCASGNANQKRMAIYCLRDLSLTDLASLTALFTGLTDPDPTVRVAAAVALKARTDVDAQGKHRLCEIYVSDADPRPRHAAAITLASLGEPTEEFLAALKKNTTSEDAQTKKAACAALALLERRPASTDDKRDG